MLHLFSDHDIEVESGTFDWQRDTIAKLLAGNRPAKNEQKTKGFTGEEHDVLEGPFQKMRSEQRQTPSSRLVPGE